MTRIALVNPSWTFDGSIYFGCREPHLPLEFGYAAALLDAAAHDVRIFDGHLFGWSHHALADQVAAYAPDMTVVATAPTYLFWRCPPPELRVPNAFIRTLGARGGAIVAVGPHGSATPGPVLQKLDADVVIVGECEETIVALAGARRRETVPGLAFLGGSGDLVRTQPARPVDLTGLGPLRWPKEWLQRHKHHHHRFDAQPDGPGAEVEASRGCPYSCSFCAKLDYRDGYRRRLLEDVIAEIDGLIEAGVTYVYFVDEIFLPNRPLLEALARRGIAFGVQTRIDLWKPEMLELLGRAGCVSIEAGVESLSPEGRAALDKNCRMSTEELAARLAKAREHVPFVQANLIASGDDPVLVEWWRERLIDAGVWANDPVPLFAYPSSPDYRKRFGEPDADAWERAHADYLERFDSFSDIQEQRPAPLHVLERNCCAMPRRFTNRPVPRAASPLGDASLT